MNQEEFISEKGNIVSAQNEANQRMSDLVKQYIEENKQFDKGDKVQITYENNSIAIGYVSNIGVHNDGELFYPMVAAKKDGTPSRNRLYHKFGKLKVEKI